MRKITKDGLNLIKRFEGFRSRKYICPAGVATIGYGHVIKKDECYNEITEEKAELLLQQDVSFAELGVIRNIHVNITDQQFAALVSFTFNLGVGALQRSTLRIKVNRRNHEEAARAFLRWVYVNGRIMPGLLKRRKAEAAMYSIR
jgi:lysozyme